MQRQPIWKPALRLLLASLALWPALAVAEPVHGEAQFDFVYGSIAVNDPVVALFVGNDITLIGLNAQAHYRLTDSLLIGGLIPVAHGRYNESSATSLGDLTAKLSYRLTRKADSASWLDTSFSFGTADDDGEGGAVASAFSVFWIPDPGLYRPNANTLRVRYRHRLQRPKYSLELIGGLQYLAVDETNTDNVLRLPLRVAGGLELAPRVEAVGKLSTVWITGADDDEDDFLHVLEAGLNIRQLGRGGLEMLLYFPLDDSYRDTFEVWGAQLAFKSEI